MKDVFIYDAIRSARTRAREDGGLHDLRPHDLLKSLYASLQARTGLDPQQVGDVVLGCVTQHGEQAGNIAKASVMYSGWPASVGGLTVNRFCSSGIDAIALGALKVAAGQEQAVVAGGVEMMSRVPMLADQAAAFIDPAFAAQCKMLMMGSGADLIGTLNGVSREQADAIALQSPAAGCVCPRAGLLHIHRAGGEPGQGHYGNRGRVYSSRYNHGFTGRLWHRLLPASAPRA